MPHTVEILLLRHGVSQWNKAGIHQGQSWNDPGLSEEGLQQAQCVANHLQNKSVLAIWTSPLPRARQTATLIHKSQLNNKTIPLLLDHGLMEMSHGIADGMPFKDIRESFPAEWQKLQQRVWTDEPLFPGGESPIQAAKRTLRTQFAIARIATIFKRNSLQTEGVIVIVTHGAVNCFFLCEITGTPLCEGWEKFPQDNCGINSLIWDDRQGEFHIKSINSTSHLGELKYTPLTEL